MYDSEKVYNAEPVYYPINEGAAKRAKGMWSFSDYIEGSETADYKSEVDRCYQVAAQVAEAKPEKANTAFMLAERFSRKYAEHINKGFQIELMCPSVMISGAGNFPVRKKEKQNARRDSHREEYSYIMGIVEKIKDLTYVSGVIKSGDENATELLQEKIDSLSAELERAKAMNKHYRSKSTMKGFEGLPDDEALKMDEEIKNGYSWEQCPAPSFELTSLRNKIKAATERLNKIVSLKQTAEAATDLYKSDVCKVVENAEIMRIQLFFDGKPDERIRGILKSNGFIWSPKNGASQRQLTENARKATKRVLQLISQEDKP